MFIKKRLVGFVINTSAVFIL